MDIRYYSNLVSFSSVCFDLIPNIKQTFYTDKTFHGSINNFMHINQYIIDKIASGMFVAIKSGNLFITIS